MKNGIYSHSEVQNRRRFLKKLSAGAISLTLGTLYKQSEDSSPRLSGPKESSVSFVTNTDQREAAYQVLKPLEKEIKKDIGEKQVVIKINMALVDEQYRTGTTEPNFVRGILDFLKPIYNKNVVIGEGTSQVPASAFDGFKRFDFMPLEKEYNVKLIDLNEQPTTLKFISDGKHHPLGINIISTYLDPNIYLISATRLKTHNNVVATLSLKNIVMGSPVNYYKQTNERGMSRTEKTKMHSGGNRGLSYNMFRLATMGIRPDLAVLDGVVGMEGNGPWGGTPIEQGIALASTDWLAADRLGVELMGIDYTYLKYLQWCSDAGMGQDDISKITIIGSDYKPHIKKYELNRNIERQIEWIREDYEI